MNKPFKCVIKDCIKHFLNSDLTSYGPNLGYIYFCRFVGHPQFGTTGRFPLSHTSLVVREYTENGKNYVETLNSIYEKSDE